MINFRHIQFSSHFSHRNEICSAKEKEKQSGKYLTKFPQEVFSFSLNMLMLHILVLIQDINTSLF